MVFNFSTIFVFFKQNTAYEMRISDWSSDVCSSDLEGDLRRLLRIDEDGVLPRLVLRRLAVALEHLEMMTVEVHGVRPAGVVAEIHHDSARSEEHTSELQSLMRISYAVFCLKKKNKTIELNTVQVRQQHTSTIAYKNIE